MRQYYIIANGVASVAKQISFFTFHTQKRTHFKLFPLFEPDTKSVTVIREHLRCLRALWGSGRTSGRKPLKVSQTRSAFNVQKWVKFIIPRVNPHCNQISSSVEM